MLTLSNWKSLKFVFWERVNSLPNDKYLDSSNLKELAYDKIDVNWKQKFFLGWVENIMGREGNAGH